MRTRVYALVCRNASESNSVSGRWGPPSLRGIRFIRLKYFFQHGGEPINKKRETFIKDSASRKGKKKQKRQKKMKTDQHDKQCFQKKFLPACPRSKKNPFTSIKQMQAIFSKIYYQICFTFLITETHENSSFKYKVPAVQVKTNCSKTLSHHLGFEDDGLVVNQ